MTLYDSEGNRLSAEAILARNRAKQKQWRIDNPEKIKEFHRKYNTKSPVKARKAQWTRDNRDVVNARRRELYRAKTSSTVQPSNSSDEEKNISI